MTTTTIGTTIRKARGDRSIREVARVSGLSRQQVMNIEQAATNYTIHSLLTLVKEVGVTITAS